MRIYHLSLKAVTLLLSGLIITHITFAQTAARGVSQVAAHAITPTSKKKQAPVATAAPVPSQPAVSEWKLVFQLGGFSAHQGRAQAIFIVDSLRENFTVTRHGGQNLLGGFGIFVDGPDGPVNCPAKLYSSLIGINLFYLPKTTVKGKIIPELFADRYYKYTVANFPIYFAIKTLYKTTNDKYRYTFDFGIGPNIIRARNYKEILPDENSFPLNAFTDHTTIAFSVEAGVGIQFNNVFKDMPLECGYRFFYLGEGRLTVPAGVVSNALRTGNGYANALICSVTV